MTNRTFIMCKPDAVERGLVGEVIARIERKGLKLAAVELRTVVRRGWGRLASAAATNACAVAGLGRSLPSGNCANAVDAPPRSKDLHRRN